MLSSQYIEAQSLIIAITVILFQASQFMLSLSSYVHYFFCGACYRMALNVLNVPTSMFYYFTLTLIVWIFESNKSGSTRITKTNNNFEASNGTSKEKTVNRPIFLFSLFFNFSKT